MENQNNAGLNHLKVLIDYYTWQRDRCYKLIDVSYTAFLDYANAKEFVVQLKQLYYKLTNKEYE